MDFKRDYNAQKEFLEKNLNNISTVVGAILGIKVNFELKKYETSHGVFFELSDPRNIKQYCGIMEKAFNEVKIQSVNIFIDGDELNKHMVIYFDFVYEHIDIGHNGAHFCTVEINNDIISVR